MPKYKKLHNRLKSKVVVELHNKQRKWVLVKDIKAVLLNYYIRVPSGFETDFASVPRIVRSLVPFEFLYNQVVVIHDFLYSTKPFPRKEADLILKEGIQYIGDYSILSKIYSNIFYWAVRLFGWSHWNK